MGRQSARIEDASLLCTIRYEEYQIGRRKPGAQVKHFIDYEGIDDSTHHRFGFMENRRDGSQLKHFKDSLKATLTRLIIEVIFWGNSPAQNVKLFCHASEGSARSLLLDPLVFLSI